VNLDYVTCIVPNYWTWRKTKDNWWYVYEDSWWWSQTTRPNHQRLLSCPRYENCNFYSLPHNTEM